MIGCFAHQMEIVVVIFLTYVSFFDVTSDGKEENLLSASDVPASDLPFGHFAFINSFFVWLLMRISDSY